MQLEQIGKYRVLAKIGQGSMGEVYKGHDPFLNRFVAIKTITASLGADEEIRKRFLREAQSAARLNHPNIITVYDFGEEHGKIYMAMELLEGRDLKELIGSHSLGDLEQKLDIMDQISDGLAFAHANDLVHRDLKPANIHVQPTGQVKILDFGLARFSASSMTRTGMVMGTPHYMSPEQVRGEKVDARSDTFSLGAVFYELLSGRRPFDGDSMHTVLFHVLQDEPEPLRHWVDVPTILVELVERALLKDPTRRFQNAQQLQDAVRAVRHVLAEGREEEATLESELGAHAAEATRGEPAAFGRLHQRGFRSVGTELGFEGGFLFPPLGHDQAHGTHGVPKLLRVLEAPGGVLQEGPLHQLDQDGRHIHPVAQRLRLVLQHVEEDRVHGVAVERPAARKQLVEHGPQREGVGAGVHLLAPDLLRRHVV